MLTADPANPGFSIAAGAVRSQGFEFTAAGQLSPSVKVLAGYVFADAVVTKDNVLPVGAPLINVPRHSGSLLAVHEAQEGPWKGFGLGGGVRAVGERAGDAAGSAAGRLPLGLLRQHNRQQRRQLPLHVRRFLVRQIKRVHRVSSSGSGADLPTVLLCLLASLVRPRAAMSLSL